MKAPGTGSPWLGGSGPPSNIQSSRSETAPEQCQYGSSSVMTGPSHQASGAANQRRNAPASRLCAPRSPAYITPSFRGWGWVEASAAAGRTGVLLRTSLCSCSFGCPGVIASRHSSSKQGAEALQKMSQSQMQGNARTDAGPRDQWLECLQ